MDPKKMTIAELKTGYGNIDVRHSHEGLTHVKGERLQPTCRALGIEFADALIGFNSTSKYIKAVTYGVVVADADAGKLRAAIEKKKAKDTPEARAKKAAAKEKRQQADIRAFAAKIRARFPSMPKGKETEIAEHTCEIGSRRIGRSRVAEDVGVDAVMAAVVSYVRHQYTDYDERLADGEDRDEVREDVGGDIAERISEWQEIKKEGENE